jgi:hypothetical protein
MLNTTMTQIMLMLSNVENSGILNEIPQMQNGGLPGDDYQTSRRC